MSNLTSQVRNTFRHAQAELAFRRKISRVTEGRARGLLIYQMGKVGSSSVTEALDALPDVETVHIHYLQPERIHAIQESQTARGLRSPFSHLDRARLILEFFLPLQPRLDVISLVRDPVARNVSAFFQNLPFYWQKITIPASDNAVRLVDDFLSK